MYFFTEQHETLKQKLQMIGEISNRFFLITSKIRKKSKLEALLLNLRNSSMSLDCLLVVFD